MAELVWKRVQTLGQGGFGVVSLASTSNALFNGVTLPSVIAVKSCNYTDSQSLKEEEEFLRMFKHSPYIIRCFGANVSLGDGFVFYNLLLEYASGGSLASRLHKCNSLPEFEVKKHTKSVLLGISCIHSNGIIHCDIKPDNILLVGTDETAKIADFGLSMTLEQGVKEKEQRMIRGTDRYMAPELVLKSDYGPQVDIWALGCTVYELLMGTPLWDADDDHVLHKIASEKPKFRNSKLSKEAKDFLRRCLVKNTKSRWTADMLLDHPFLSNSSEADSTAKKRKRKSDSMSLLHKPIQKITLKLGHRKFVKKSDSMSLLHRPIQKIIFKIGHRKFVRVLGDPKEVENEINLWKGIEY